MADSARVGAARVSIASSDGGLMNESTTTWSVWVVSSAIRASVAATAASAAATAASASAAAARAAATSATWRCTSALMSVSDPATSELVARRTSSGSTSVARVAPASAGEDGDSWAGPAPLGDGASAGAATTRAVTTRTMARRRRAARGWRMVTWRGSQSCATAASRQLGGSASRCVMGM